MGEITYTMVCKKRTAPGRTHRAWRDLEEEYGYNIKNGPPVIPMTQIFLNALSYLSRASNKGA
eukprot:1160670-Pelagomonas_calceolata.AAC.3